ncbi:hypothetical protein DdX_06271 [Ditylenchus destructor]|uniref:Uncharacterized protein n=1 Tax=Ditylenchus destructor TaxID=166010 RepID=A0AAD4R9H9_9BILA|nr:hypothetical protein DdX_06271 [Ditylenchus destructor]
MSDSFGFNRFSGNEGSPTDGEDDEDEQGCEVDNDTIAEGPTNHTRNVLHPTSSHARDALSTHQRTGHKTSKSFTQQESRADVSNNLSWPSRSKVPHYILESSKTRNHQAQNSEAKQCKPDHQTSSRKTKRDTSRNRIEMKILDHCTNGYTKGSVAAMTYWNLVNSHFTAKVKKGHFPKDIPPPPAVHETIEMERAHLQKTFQALPNSEILLDHKQNNILVEDDVIPHKHQRNCLDYTTKNVVNISPLNLRADAESNEAAERPQQRESCRVYENLFSDPVQYDIVSPDPEYYRRRVNKLNIEETVKKLREIRVRCRQTRLEKERIAEEKHRLDELERERRSSLSTYDLPPSRLTTERYWQPMSARQPMSHRPPLRSSLRNLGARKSGSDTAFGIPKRTRSKSPFINAANQRNHVSFSVPANGQQLLSIIKNNQPCLLELAKQVLQTADKNRLLQEFLEAMERRVDLLRRSFVRIEQCLRNANEVRRTTLMRKLNEIQSQLRYCLKKVDEIHALVVAPEVQICLDARSTPQLLSQIKLLQQVFDKP